MKATIVLIANNEIEHYGKKLMLEAHKIGNLGFEMARLPEHISLKQPFSITNIDEFESFFDPFAKSVKPINIKFTNGPDAEESLWSILKFGIQQKEKLFEMLQE